MSTNPRATQFAGFAKLLVDRLFVETNAQNWREFLAQAEPIIAQSAYDLVAHTIENTEHIDLDRLTTDEHVQRIPDLTEWPKERK